MLEAVAETDPAALAEALDRLAEAEVIVPEGSAGVDYRFRHALIRDAVYQSQGPALRHQAHARVARALEVTFPEQAAAHPELVALHLTEARQERAAIAWWVRGGTRARQRAAYAGAIEQLRRGLDLLPAALPPGPDRDRIELEIKVSLGISLQATLGFAAPEVGEIHARARELCRTVEGGPLLLGALGGLFLYYLYRSDFRSAREMAEQHLQVTEIIGARNRLCASYSALGYTAFQVGAPAEARAHFERSIELIDTYPRPEGTALTPNNIGVASESMLALTLCLLGHREAAAVAIDGALARAERCPPGERAFSTALCADLREPAAPDDGRAARGPALRAGGHADRPRARLRGSTSARARWPIARPASRSARAPPTSSPRRSPPGAGAAWTSTPRTGSPRSPRAGGRRAASTMRARCSTRRSRRWSGTASGCTNPSCTGCAAS